MSGDRNLPVLRNVGLRYFSLYRNQRRLSVDVNRGVFCLAGANGLGKSTFLAAINFGFTGIVANSGRSFQNVDEYYAKSLPYSEKYFDGVIDEEDRDRAHVELSFSVGHRHYRIARNLFSPSALEILEITEGDGSVLPDGPLGPEERQRVYADEIARDCNVGSFEYFVFLQHFVMTFDERRDLLFWNDRTANSALYLAFGLDPQDVVRAEQLRSGINAADSNARNAQWQATLARRRLDKMQPGELADIEQIRGQHNALVEQFDTVRAEADRAERAAADARLALAEASSQHLSLRMKYDDMFSARLSGHPDPKYHPLIVRIVSDEYCEVCGTEGKQVAAAVKAALKSGSCPVCSSQVAQHGAGPAFEVLETLDRQLADAGDQTKTAQTRLQRLEAESKSLAQKASDAAEALAAFEEANTEAIARFDAVPESDAQQRRATEEEYRAATARRNDFRKRRDEFRAELEPIQQRLVTAYQDGEVEFVPTFRRLAKQFIGLDLDVHLETESDTFKLSLEVQGSRRRTTTSLSESQRFFLEIALRMTLLQHMANPESPGALYIDTPEGSLDIAYEARAGDMFASFIQDGANIVMTANINSSQLLLRLAAKCGAENMRLLRMTDWTPLSEVQAEEESLFIDAYGAIEKKLRGESATNDETHI